eukprot:2016531-Karenia_brevis.AAC.1
MSQHPAHLRASIFTAESSRFALLCPTAATYSKALDQFKQTLVNRGYPVHLICFKRYDSDYRCQKLFAIQD